MTEQINTKQELIAQLKSLPLAEREAIVAQILQDNEQQKPFEPSPEDGFICPSQASQRPHETKLNYWRTTGSDRTCSYCGSWHPEEFIAFLSEVIDESKPNHLIETSDKDYKLYVERPEIKNAGEGAIKFYKWHFQGFPLTDEIRNLYTEAMKASAKKWDAKFGQLRRLPEESDRSHDT